MKKSSKASKRAPKTDCTGMGGFSIKGKGPRSHKAPKTFAGRRAASHAKAYQD